MKEHSNILFVGQAFNREFGTKILPKLKGKSQAVVERTISHYALTGAVGTSLGLLLGMSRLEFCASFKRTNLNVNFTGKAGKGDCFDADEGRARAFLLKQNRELTKFVMLGQRVAECFGVKDWKPLDIHINGGQSFFCLPHPSGINRWWNESENHELAAANLREFIYS